MIMDSYIDSIFPNLEGKTFKYKYEKLPRNNYIEIMFSQIYRILKLYRNATVHNINGISITQEHLKINFMHRNMNIRYLFIITHKGIEIIEDMLLCYFYYKQRNYSYNYKEYLLYSFYCDILNEIESFNDEFIESMIINSIKINRYERFNCNSIKYEISNSKIIFNIPKNLIDNNYAIDINISIDGNLYIIPIEVLNNQNIISTIELKKFKLE